MGTKGRKTRGGAAALMFTAGAVAAFTSPAAAEVPKAPDPPPPPDDAARVREAALLAERDERVVRSHILDADDDRELVLDGDGEAVATLGTTESDARDDDGEAHSSTVVAELPNGGTRVAAVIDERPEDDEITFPISIDEDVFPWLVESGQVVFLRGVDVVGVIDVPWAVDVAGREVATSFELRDGELVQRLALDDPAIQYPVVADPSYWQMSHSISAHGGGDAVSYGRGWTRPLKDFTQKRGYYPVFGSNQGTTRAVRQSGECSWYPDTGLYWDFQIPCKFHDYCWDLIRVSRVTPNYGKVKEGACDNEFRTSMMEHCNSRGFWGGSEPCKAEATAVYLAVQPFSP